MSFRICRTLVAGVVLMSALTVAGCSSRKYDGQWAGTTTQGHTINFTVSGGVITATRVEIDLTCQRTGYCPAGALIDEDLGASLSGDSFSGSIEGKATVSGKFDSETTVTGELKIEENDANCGACTANFTWTAKKL